MTDFDGNVFTTASGSPNFHIDSNGVALDSSNGMKFMLDGKESFSIAADTPLVFEGVRLRGFSQSQMTIQSDGWKGLSGVIPRAGYSYDSARGSFLITADNAKLVSAKNLVGVSGPRLLVGAGVSIAFDNALDSTEPVDGFGKLFAIEGFVYSAVNGSVVARPVVSEPVVSKPIVSKPIVSKPEPSVSDSALFGFGGVTLMLRRRR